MANFRMTGSERQSRKVEKLGSSSAGIMLARIELRIGLGKYARNSHPRHVQP